MVCLDDPFDMFTAKARTAAEDFRIAVRAAYFGVQSMLSSAGPVERGLLVGAMDSIRKAGSGNGLDRRRHHISEACAFITDARDNHAEPSKVALYAPIMASMSQAWSAIDAHEQDIVRRAESMPTAISTSVAAPEPAPAPEPTVEPVPVEMPIDDIDRLIEIAVEHAANPEVAITGSGKRVFFVRVRVAGDRGAVTFHEVRGEADESTAWLTLPRVSMDGHGKEAARKTLHALLFDGAKPKGMRIRAAIGGLRKTQENDQ